MTFQGHHRLEWTVAIGGCALIAVLLTLGDLPDALDADSVVPVLVSLQRWTRYYWEQDRFGMLVPLLALPVRSPFANLVVQSGLSAFAALMTFVLGARLLSHRPGAVLAGVIAATLFFLTASRALAHDLTTLAQPYGVSLALTFAGLICLDHVPVTRPNAPRLVGGVVLLTLGVFVNLALVLLVGPFLVLRALPQLKALLAARRPPRTYWRDPAAFAILAFAVATLVNALSAWTSPHRGVTSTGLVPLLSWPRAWATFLHRTLEALPASWLLVAAMATAALIVFIAVPSPRGITQEELVGTVSALVVSVGAWGVTGALHWLSVNDYLLRYAVPSLVFGFLAVVAFAFTRITLAPRLRLGLMIGCIGLLGAAVMNDYGAPSLTARRRALDRFGEHTEALLRSGATHLAGSYWAVWPAVFHAEVVRHERGLDGVLYGLSHRSAPTRKYWRHWPAERHRVAARSDDPDPLWWARYYKLPALAATERAGGITIYTAAR